jgi:hypothetical protein
VFNFIVSVLTAGVITATGARYLVDIEEHSKQVSSAYVKQAKERFEEYDKLLPGIVKW